MEEISILQIYSIFSALKIGRDLNNGDKIDTFTFAKTQFAMQERHRNHDIYFQEQAACCRKYYIPYIKEHSDITLGETCSVLEVGCGIGGGISVFAEAGCKVMGVDIHAPSIRRAEQNFASRGLSGEFKCLDIFEWNDFSQTFDLIIMHDTFEHIPQKEKLLLHLKNFLKDDGILYVGFPAWQMPFGGHQQMAKSRIASRLPYIHLLPRPLFKAVFKAFGETDRSLQTFLEIRDTRVTIESFSRLVERTGYRVIDKTWYLINPNYEIKFGLKPRKLPALLGAIPYVRDFFATTCYYLLAK